MFGRFIGKISSFNKTATLRSFNQIKSANSKQEVFPISCGSFKRLTESGNVFADKTLLIKKLLESQNTAFLFTRPRRWGKTLNLKMIEAFFKADVDETTGELNFKSQSNKILFKHLDISKVKVNYNIITNKKVKASPFNFLGKFPVIKVTFGHLMPPDKNSMIDGFAHMLRSAFLDHGYLLKSNKSLDEPELELINFYINCIHEGISWTKTVKSLQYLINAIYTHYGRKVILLIDEYDKPLNDMYASQSPFLNDAIDLLKSLFNPVKNNQKLLFTIFIGATKLTKADIFTGLNNFYHDSVLNSEFSEFFGLTEIEVDQMIEKLVILNPTLSGKDVKESVTNWYNGYKIGNKIIYNPWSIMNCLDLLYKGKDPPYKQHWIETGSTKLVEKALMEIPTYDKIEQLIMDGETEFVYSESFTFENIKTSEDELLSLLLNSGYITLDKNNIYKIPNNEVKLYFNSIMHLFLEKHYKKDGDILVISFENAEVYGQVFQQKVLKTMRFKDCTEGYFQSLILFPFDNKNNFQVKHEIYMEKRTDDNNRIDILLTPIEENCNSVFILELKKTDLYGSIIKIIKEAFFQVFSKGYIDSVLENARIAAHIHWEIFHIRVVVFSPDESGKKWIITIKEFKLNKERLKTACNAFKNSNKDMEEIIELLTLHSNSHSEYQDYNKL